MAERSAGRRRDGATAGSLLAPFRFRFAVLVGAALVASGCASARRLFVAEGLRAVDADVAYAMLRDAPDLVVVDVREIEEFEGERGHLRFARNLPLSKLETFLGLLAPLRETSFLVYCRADDGCGEEAVARLVAAGLPNAVVLDGGFEAWLAHGYPALSAAPPASVDRTREALGATHRIELASAQLVAGGRVGANGLYVAGRTTAGRFRPVGSVEGVGDFCRGGERRSGERGRRGWLELARQGFLGEDEGRLPSRPFVRGCLAADGVFRPESRDVTP